MAIPAPEDASADTSEEAQGDAYNGQQKTSNEGGRPLQACTVSCCIQITSSHKPYVP